MGNTFYFQWEADLMKWLQAALGESGISVISHFSAFGEDLFMICVLGFLFWGIDKKAGKYVGMVLIMNIVWFPMIKNIALRRRPYFDNASIRCFRPVDPDADIYDIAKQGYSFPSGHSASSAATYGSTALYFKKKGLTLLCILLPVLVGISRICVGAHYPTDVICGWLLGTILVFLIPWLDRVIEKRSTFYALLFLAAIPGIFYCNTTDYFTGLGMLIGLLTAIPFEEKYVRFENTKKPFTIALRILGGIAVYLVLSVLLKLPFSDAFLASESAACFTVRVIRYAVILFIEIGVYPMLFRRKVMN